MAGCASTRPHSSVDVPPAVVDAEPGTIEQLLRDEIEQWHGTPHQWGGITRGGADCSGFIYSVYRDLFSMSLPRTTGEQVQVGTSVRVNDLRAGDLVFFKPTKRSNHVGIYLSDGYFAHISSSRGLMYSHLDERYWQRAYWTTRRVVRPGAVHASSTTTTVETPPAADNPGRGGW